MEFLFLAIARSAQFVLFDCMKMKLGYSTGANESHRSK